MDELEQLLADMKALCRQQRKLKLPVKRIYALPGIPCTEVKQERREKQGLRIATSRMIFTGIEKVKRRVFLKFKIVELACQ
jgi:hypothetical protein